MTSAEPKSSFSFGSVKLGAGTICGLIGFSFFVLGVFGLLVYVPDYAFDGAAVSFARFVMALAMVVSFLIVRFFAPFLARMKSRPILLMSVLGVVALATFAALGKAIAPLGGMALLAFASFALVASGGQWFVAVGSQSHKVVGSMVSTGLLVGLSGCALFGYLLDYAALVSLIFAHVVSTACLVCLLRVDPETYLPVEISNKDSDKRKKILKTSSVMLAFNSFEVGFVVNIASELHAIVFCLLSACAVLLLVAIDGFRKQAISERSVSPLTPPLTTAMFAIVCPFGDVVTIIALCVLSGIAALYTVFGFAALAEHVRISRLSPLRVYGSARALDYLFLAAGLLAGWAVAGLLVSAPFAATQCTIVLAVGYSFLAAFCHKVRFPEPAVELLDHDLPNSKGMWKKRCLALSERCGLSDRQCEVLMLVAQGRNAKYIEQTLSISLSTAQTHIRNIYRKAGVHSRQELLDLIESTKLYGED